MMEIYEIACFCSCCTTWNILQKVISIWWLITSISFAPCYISANITLHFIFAFSWKFSDKIWTLLHSISFRSFLYFLESFLIKLWTLFHIQVHSGHFCILFNVASLKFIPVIFAIFWKFFDKIMNPGSFKFIPVIF